MEARGLCYVTGNKDEMLTSQHGARIRNAGDMAKLISANDHVGFTYRGRFADPQEAVQVGYDVSQKSHQALRWLVQRQGSYVDTRYFLAFGVEHTDVPPPFSGVLDILSEDLKEKSETKPLTESVVAEEINKAMQGYERTFTDEELNNIIIMALDAATSGRLSIVYYQELNPRLYLDNLTHWHQSCRWLLSSWNKETKRYRRFVGSPSTYRIVEAVYGRRGDSRIKKELYTRLLPCIVEGKAIPKDVIRTIYYRVINPESFRQANESWEDTLHVACALINKEYESEGYTVALQKDNDSRDYLFGRLLGIAEVMERGILKERNETRSTNATRYFNSFSQHPARTWQVIRKQLNPYFVRLGSNATFYAMQIQEIESRIRPEEMTNEPLGPVFLLGYSSQIQDLYTKKEEKNDDSLTK